MILHWFSHQCVGQFVHLQGKGERNQREPKAYGWTMYLFRGFSGSGADLGRQKTELGRKAQGGGEMAWVPGSSRAGGRLPPTSPTPASAQVLQVKKTGGGNGR